MQCKYNGETVTAISSKLGNNPKLIDESDFMRIEHLQKSEGMLQDIMIEDGTIIQDVPVKKLTVKQVVAETKEKVKIYLPTRDKHNFQ